MLKLQITSQIGAFFLWGRGDPFEHLMEAMDPLQNIHVLAATECGLLGQFMDPTKPILKPVGARVGGDG